MSEKTVQYMSDLHFEFHRDGGASFVASLKPEGVDVLILAGDIAVGDGIGPALDLFCERYEDAVVVVVHGNHEFYGTTRERVVEVTTEAEARHGNLLWLDCDVAEIQGLRILGAPLWFQHPGIYGHYRRGMNDFSQIMHFEDWVYGENKHAIEFLEREMRAGDIVVTHYLPTQASVPKRFVGNALNIFFVCDVEPLMVSREPAVWVHGHTHDSVNKMVGKTRVLCNPYGYVRHETNPNFNEHKTFKGGTTHVEHDGREQGE